GRRSAVLVGVAVYRRHRLGAREQVRGRTAGRARRHGEGGIAVIGLEDVAAVVGVGEAAGEGLRLVGDERRRPILVGDADPAVGDAGPDLLLVLLDVGVADHLE